MKGRNERMKFFHGTTEESAKEIEAEGFYGSELSTFTNGGRANDPDGVVYLTDSIDEAKGYGEVVFEVELLNGEPTFFQEAPTSGAKEFYVTVSQLREDGIWKRQRT
jgi:hypothetical protein